jgi:formylglycine-generating enzyme required for sulfatase activity
MKQFAFGLLLGLPALLLGGLVLLPMEARGGQGRNSTILLSVGQYHKAPDPMLVRDKKTPRPGEERSLEIAEGVKMVFCWVPAGTAQLGSPKAERDQVLRGFPEGGATWLAAEAEEVRGKYTTKGFWLAKYPVTQEQWKAVMGDNPSHFDGKRDNKAKGLDTSRFPVEMVSWDDCQKFVEKVNKRLAGKGLGGKGKVTLPHEDEWEYACRGGKGNKRPFYWGDSLNGKEANCCGDSDPYGTKTKGPNLERTTTVGSYEKAAPHPWGLCDMAGNVWQWCENLHQKDSTRRVFRGGSWSSQATSCRAASRASRLPGSREKDNGLRLAFRLD